MGECAKNHQLLPIPDHQGPPLNHQPVHLAIPEARGKLRTNCSKNQYSTVLDNVNQILLHTLYQMMVIGQILNVTSKLILLHEILTHNPQ